MPDSDFLETVARFFTCGEEVHEGEDELLVYRRARPARGIEVFQSTPEKALSEHSNRGSLVPRTPIFSSAKKGGRDERYFVGRVREAVLNGDPGMNKIVQDMMRACREECPRKSHLRGIFKRRNPGLKLLVLDLDETLIFAGKDYDKFWEVLEYSNGARIGLNRRPHLAEFLRQAARMFELAVFTAGNRAYADEMISRIDPEGLIQHRVFREHCLEDTDNPENAFLVKDLDIFDVPASEVLIVDNSAFCFQKQLANGVPILPFSRNSRDRELPALLEFLGEAARQPDVRKYNRWFFKLHDYWKFDQPRALVE